MKQPRDELIAAARDLRGNEAFGRFIKALSQKVLFSNQQSQTSDQAMRFEGERDTVIFINNIVETVNNE